MCFEFFRLKGTNIGDQYVAFEHFWTGPESRKKYQFVTQYIGHDTALDTNQLNICCIEEVHAKKGIKTLSVSGKEVYQFN